MVFLFHCFSCFLAIGICFFVFSLLFISFLFFFFFSSRRRHTRLTCDWSSDVCSSDLKHDSVPSEKRRRLRQQLREWRGNLNAEDGGDVRKDVRPAEPACNHCCPDQGGECHGPSGYVLPEGMSARRPQAHQDQQRNRPNPPGPARPS